MVFKQALDQIKAIGDPAQRAQVISDVLNQCPDLSKALRELRQAAVVELREQGKSHGQVAEILGISRGRAQQIAEGRTTGKRAEVHSEEALAE